MATKVADLTLEELQAWVEGIIENKLHGEQVVKSRLLNQSPVAKADTRTLEEVFAIIDTHMWTPPPGTPSSTELIREDRDNDEPYR